MNNLLIFRNIPEAKAGDPAGDCETKSRVLLEIKLSVT